MHGRRDRLAVKERQERSDRRHRSSQGKYKRMSLGAKKLIDSSQCNHLQIDTTLMSDFGVGIDLISGFQKLTTASPSPRAKSSSSTWRRQSSSSFSPSPLMRGSAPEIGSASLDSPSALTEKNFWGVIIGGTYQHCFQDNAPVIAPPGISNVRVTSLIRSVDGGVELTLYIPKLKEERKIAIARGWCLNAVRPGGYLIGAEGLVPKKRTKHFFLQSHPDDWINESEEPLNSFSRTCSNASLSSSVDSWIFVGNNDLSVPSSSAGQSANPPFTNFKTAMSNIAAWDNPSIVALAMEFLIGPDFDYMRPMLICKAWAVGVISVLARRRCHAISTSPAITSNNWKSFLKSHIWGSFLSEGACKKVYRVQDQQQQLHAVSVMDLDDLEEKGMSEVVAQELEISMVCSSLNTMRISPNFVLINSLFRSAKMVPGNMWNSTSPVPLLAQRKDFRIPRSSTRDDGDYQFIEMELCRGGDVEELVRKQDVFDIATVRIVLFQMCFALYAGRSQLSLRHFDIKLLNFFATSGCDIFRENGQVSEEPDKDVTLRMGFSNNWYTVPLRGNCFDLVKLADFGTSVIGTGALGDMITVQQVLSIIKYSSSSC